MPKAEIFFHCSCWFLTLLPFLLRSYHSSFPSLLTSFSPAFHLYSSISSLLCGNKMPTRFNRGFLLQILLLAQHVSGTTMPIIRSLRVLYSGCCLWYFVLWFSSCWSGVELRVMCLVCRMLQNPANRTHNPQLHTRPATWKPQHEIPQAATTV